MVQVATSDSTTCDVELLKDEVGGLMMEESINTVTFLQKNTDDTTTTDFTTAATSLKDQFVRVVQSNPWLAGSLVKTKAGIRLRHPTNPTESQIVKELTNIFVNEDHSKPQSSPPSLSIQTPYTSMCKSLIDPKAKTRLVVGSGRSDVGRDRPVALFDVIKCDNKNRSINTGDTLAVVFSMSHAVGDGRTYYEVWKMLRPGATVRALEVNRVKSFPENVRDTCGRKELEWADRPSTMCMYTCAMVTSSGKVRCRAYRVDPDRADVAKREAVTQRGDPNHHVPYVSTNDVITSGFLNCCGARIGMMGIDCRGRVTGINGKNNDDDESPFLAGNYVSALTLDPDTFATPSRLRNVLSSMPYVTTKQPLPTCRSWLCGKDSANFAMVTNWSSFVGPDDMLALPGFDTLLHLPVLNPAVCVYNMMIPFAASRAKDEESGKKRIELAVLCWTVDTDEDELRQTLPLGDCISENMFPKE